MPLRRAPNLGAVGDDLCAPLRRALDIPPGRSNYGHPAPARRTANHRTQGSHYAQNPYDRERYERLMELTTRYYGEALDLPPAEPRERLHKELGYVTPIGKLHNQGLIATPA
jgi:hypothetical protein